MARSDFSYQFNLALTAAVNRLELGVRTVEDINTTNGRPLIADLDLPVVPCGPPPEWPPE